MEIDFLERLLDAAGPSGFEVRPAHVWRKGAESFADRVGVDVSGNSVAELNPQGSPRVMLAGHIDEIGLQVTHIDEHGFLFVDEIGGWDAHPCTLPPPHTDRCVPQNNITANIATYGPLNYRTAARTLFLRPYLAHFCPVFSRFFAVFSVLTPGFQKVAPKDRGPVP